ncbi:hypothetical protein CJP74_00510 [Psittacicella melopsittaci]|uniref:Uncharacterized protein n=1 Tax=Psittacicella melopsittaci TaxID=2028576 RepID=A0A3A1Y9P2_9GAMM|nr:hypothetical protein CJP74_00510 [Psittacicella melopsittaci]
MVVFVANQEDKEHVLKLRGERKTTVIIYDLLKEKAELLERVTKVLFDPEYRSKVSPELLENGNIEYFKPEYNVVNFAKTFFVNYAIDHNLVEHEQVAWVDFGYHRGEKFFKGLTRWEFDFTPNKINFFNVMKKKRIPPFNTEEQVFRYMYENHVYIVGCIFAGDHKAWREFNTLLNQSIEELLSKNIIDDDQGVYMYCMLKRPELFKVRYVGVTWKVDNIANLYNQNSRGFKIRKALRALIGK